MKKATITIILTFSMSILFAQNPLLKQWDYRFGGNQEDVFRKMIQVNDGGYLLGGHSLSGISGEKTQLNWDVTGTTYDMWVVKINSLGIKQWDKRFGGTDWEYLNTIIQTSDGGFIIGGSSESGIGGDKTEASRGNSDFWIIKIDSAGNKQWDKRYGGVYSDELQCIKQTDEGGYILGGWSDSGFGGDKTQSCWGNADFWVIKTDSLGIKQWDKRFGGTMADKIYSLDITEDHGYILGGFSYSGLIGGDKTQSCWGESDMYMVKIDSAGNKQWDKRFGGFDSEYVRSIYQTDDKGYILGGTSDSGTSGDKTQPPLGIMEDYYIVKTDSLGIKQWEKVLGGTSSEDYYDFGCLYETNDGGYLISGVSYSGIGADKTENNLGPEQIWVVKTDSLCNKQWDKTVFTNAHDEYGYAIQGADDCYLMANYTGAGVGGYKTQPSWLSLDYWIVKFCDTTLTTSISYNAISQLQISIYPNPFVTHVSISIQNQNQAAITIRNMLGQTVFHQQENHLSIQYTKTIDLGFLSSGIYLIEVIAAGQRSIQKLVKE